MAVAVRGFTPARTTVTLPVERTRTLSASLGDMPQMLSPLTLHPRPPSSPEQQIRRKTRSNKKQKDKTRSYKKQRSKSCLANSGPRHSVDSAKGKPRDGDLKLPSLPGMRRSRTKTPTHSKLPGRAESAPKITTTNTSVVQKPDTKCGTDTKKTKKVPLLASVAPLNLESEKDKFMKAKYNYNPQFLYRNPPSEATMERHGTATEHLLPQALQILSTALKRHGSFEQYAHRTGGRKLTRVEILNITKKFLRLENLDNEILVQLRDDMVPRACMTRVKGQSTLQVRSGEIREFWVDGMLRHEIGTHYLRSRNNRYQPWCNWRTRKDLKMRALNPTEEGLASLHSVIFRDDPSLWRSAFLYYTIWKASQVSFCELFKDLGLYVDDPNVRWDYCVRAKRGLIDTSQQGAFCKDQVYLTGGLSILKRRSHLDFHMLVRAGKVCFRDLDRIQDMVETEDTRIPGFMKDLTVYRKALDHIAEHNGLSDDLLMSC